MNELPKWKILKPEIKTIDRECLINPKIILPPPLLTKLGLTSNF